MRVLVTRAAQDAVRTAARLREMGHTPILSPVIDIVPTGATLPEQPFDAIIATSAHAFAPAMQIPHALQGATLLVVGKRTAEAAKHNGFGEAEIVAPDADAFLAALDEDFPPPFRFLYLAGRDRKPDIERTLTARGHEVTVLESYEAKAASAVSDEAHTALSDGSVDAVLHYSRRSAEIFCALLEGSGITPGKAVHVVISPDAAAPLQQRGWPVRVPETPDEEAMLRALATPAI